MAIIKKPRGTQDLFPPKIFIHHQLLSKLKKIVEQAGYFHVETPIFEHQGLFLDSEEYLQGLLVEEKTYSFSDRKGRKLILRPEGTIPVARLLKENFFSRLSNVWSTRVYYHSSMFRYERPQKARYRQFWQFGIEAVGGDPLIQDLEVISLLDKFRNFLSSVYTLKVKLKLNFFGSQTTKNRYLSSLTEETEELKKKKKLCSKCLKRTNLFRIVECFSCLPVLRSRCKQISDFWTHEEKSYFHSLIDKLLSLGIEVDHDVFLFRGLAYYTAVVFELSSSVGEIAGGGRYARIVCMDKGSCFSSVGWAIGLDRIVYQLFKEKKRKELERKGFFQTSELLTLIVWREKRFRYLAIELFTSSPFQNLICSLRKRTPVIIESGEAKRLPQLFSLLPKWWKGNVIRFDWNSDRELGWKFSLSDSSFFLSEEEKKWIEQIMKNWS